ncbi:VWA domain-containing protein [Spirochaetia bacterium 38H-sp]|uniref:VWA domain-containing protein n=1 Tax=Rarispira pelagica TaxID=3141764 RepID=A0ABU9UF60_9SPIR
MDVDIAGDGVLKGRLLRSEKKTTGTRGRAVSVRPFSSGEKISDVSFFSSFIAAISEGDKRPSFPHLRRRVRKKDATDLVVFLVDASESMGVKRRMAVAKGAALSLLRRAYIYRCRVAIVSFYGDSADVIMQPSVSAFMASKAMEDIRVGDATPLPAGLLKAWDIIRLERFKGSADRASLVLISDAESNVPIMAGNDSFLEAVEILGRISSSGVNVLLLDAGDGDKMRYLASSCSASYHRLPSSGSLSFIEDILSH